MSSQGAHWTALARPARRGLPIALLADVLDRESAAAEGPWVAAPLTRHAASGELLLLHGRCPAPAPNSLRTIEALAAMLASALGTVHRAGSTSTPESAAWKRFWKSPASGARRNEMEPLLKQMAEAATRLLRCRSGQHLPLGSAEPHARRPARLGRRRGRAAHPGQLGRRRPGGSHRASRARGQQPTSPTAESIAKSTANWATRPARCCACRCGAAGASCSARSR